MNGTNLHIIPFVGAGVCERKTSCYISSVSSSDSGISCGFVDRMFCCSWSKWPFGVPVVTAGWYFATRSAGKPGQVTKFSFLIACIYVDLTGEKAHPL